MSPTAYATAVHADELSPAQLVDVVMHFGAIEGPDELELVARRKRISTLST